MANSFIAPARCLRSEQLENVTGFGKLSLALPALFVSNLTLFISACSEHCVPPFAEKPDKNPALANKPRGGGAPQSNTFSIQLPNGCIVRAKPAFLRRLSFPGYTRSLFKPQEFRTEPARTSPGGAILPSPHRPRYPRGTGTPRAAPQTPSHPHTPSPAPSTEHSSTHTSHPALSRLRDPLNEPGLAPPVPTPLPGAGMPIGSAHGVAYLCLPTGFPGLSCGLEPAV